MYRVYGFIAATLLLPVVASRGRRSLVETPDGTITMESQAALKSYLDLHKREPKRELYVAHTSRQALNIEERRWAGVRAPA